MLTIEIRLFMLNLNTIFQIEVWCTATSDGSDYCLRYRGNLDPWFESRQVTFLSKVT